MKHLLCWVALSLCLSASLSAQKAEINEWKEPFTKKSERKNALTLVLPANPELTRSSLSAVFQDCSGFSPETWRDFTVFANVICPELSLKRLYVYFRVTPFVSQGVQQSKLTLFFSRTDLKDKDNRSNFISSQNDATLIKQASFLLNRLYVTLVTPNAPLARLPKNSALSMLLNQVRERPELYAFRKRNGYYNGLSILVEQDAQKLQADLRQKLEKETGKASRGSQLLRIQAAVCPRISSQTLDFYYKVESLRSNPVLSKATLFICPDEGEFLTSRAQKATMELASELLAELSGGAAPVMATRSQEGVAAQQDLDTYYNIKQDLPRTRTYHPNSFAVLIGNSQYQKAQPVDFAINDAQSIKRYLIEMLGFKPGNIFMLNNASKGDFETYFGTRSNPRGKLFNSVVADQSEVFVFYSGHGAPSLKEDQKGKGFFLPVECDPNYVELGGYSLEVFYKNLSLLPAKSKTVVIDACFSGANVFKNVSPVFIKTEKTAIDDPNLVVLASSSGTEVSTWYNHKRHGLFTYFFLKALHDQKNSDRDGDGRLSLGEIYRYLGNDQKGVPYYARRIHGLPQNPTIEGAQQDRIFLQYAK